MTSCNLNHDRYKLSCVGQADILRQLKHRSDCPFLFKSLQFTERSREVAAGTKYGRSTRGVVPVGGGVQNHIRSANADEKLLNQKAVVEDDVHY